MEEKETVKKLKKRMDLWVKKQWVKHFFSNKGVIKLSDVTNSSMQSHIGTEVRLRWMNQGVLISLDQGDIKKCRQSIITSQIQDIETGPDCVVLFTSNSRYEFRRYR